MCPRRCAVEAALRSSRLTFLAWIAGSLIAQDAGSSERDDALRLAAEGRCAEALPLLEDATGGDAQRARGLCRLRLADYSGAASDLAAVELTDPSVALDLAIARYHAGQAGPADEALRRAEARGEARAELHLYLGLLALERADGRGAAARFERARERDALQVEPAASYYAGLAHGRAGERAAARESLERVIAEWPGTSWAEQAERALAAIGSPRALFLGLRAGNEHDTNAVLRGDDVVLPDEIPGDEDQRFVWRAVAGATRSLAAGTQLGASLAGSGSLHGDLSEFDVLQPSLTAWLDQRVSERLTLRALASYAYAWVDAVGFLSSPGLALELYQSWEEAGTTRAFLELTRDSYLFENEQVDDFDSSLGDCPGAAPCSPFPIDEPTARNRDGLGLRAGVEHRLGLSSLRSDLIGTLAFRRFSARGTEYSFDSPEAELAFESALPAGFAVTGSARFAYRPFRHPTTFPDPDALVAGEPYPLASTKRRERDWRTELSLRKALGPQIGVEARWRYQRNHSTAKVFDFERHIFGLYATWSLGG